MNVTDPRPGLGHALDQTGRLIDALPPDRLTAPTPCEEYDVQQLVSHLLSVVRRIDLALRGGNALDIPLLTEADDRVAAWTTYRQALESTVADDEVLTSNCRLPWATLPGAAAIVAYTCELATHSWDLARAIDRADLLEERVAESCLPMARQFIPAEYRGGEIPFGRVVAVPADAPAYSQLAGWMGREPAWSPGQESRVVSSA